MFKNGKPQAERYPEGDKIISHRIGVVSRAVYNVIQYGDIATGNNQPPDDALKAQLIVDEERPDMSDKEQTVSIKKGFITVEDARHQVDDSFNGRAA